MDASGVAVLEDVIPATMLAAAREYIAAELVLHDHQYFGLSGREWIAASPLDALSRSDAFREILCSLWERQMHNIAPADDVRASLRVLAGTVGMRHSNLFHYDSYVVTALVPLLIPDGPNDPRGELVVYPNLRNVRRLAIVNIIEKLIVESALACWLWRMPMIQRRLSARAVPMEPGHIYFFWGMRSLHANRACKPEHVRSTALFHFGDPHARSLLKRLSARRHRARLRRLSRAAGSPQ
ncbi:hypothetical protein [Paraburkholderia sp.]|uniref:hypothetical protein n=1 Tax=Paraburkholderia sp. TaxID=1926495 RepID=UPI00239AB343|nr:hypothetical protein [Paraburkholderia sp.]MDE1180208.1 hypothetical protein [Paraburkholderia sp.]